MNETHSEGQLARATCELPSETRPSVDALIYEGAANKDNKLQAAAARRGFVADKRTVRQSDSRTGRQDVPQASDKSNS